MLPLAGAVWFCYTYHRLETDVPLESFAFQALANLAPFPTAGAKLISFAVFLCR